MMQNRNRLIADFSLLLVALVWGSAFVAQRLAAGQLGGFLFNGLRFVLGAAVLTPLLLPLVQQGGFQARLKSASRGVLLAGVLLFTAAAFQQFGLFYTTAGNAGFITGLYVVFIPLIGALVLRKPPRPVIWPAAGLAVIGLFLLSAGGRLQVNRGDALELAGSFLWAFHVLVIGALVKRIDVRLLSVGQFLVCGVLNLLFGLLFEMNTLPVLRETWIAVAYTGLLSVGFGYTIQAAAQRYAPPADAALLLSLEAPFAALAGWLILQEQLTPIQLLGCGLMLGGTLLAELPGIPVPRSLIPGVGARHIRNKVQDDG